MVEDSPSNAEEKVPPTSSKGADESETKEKESEGRGGGPPEGDVRPSIRICLVRHAESKNNEVYRDARHTFKGGTPDFDKQGWIDYVNERRSHDPGISSTGQRQAEKLASYLVPHLENQASSPVQIITSPMKRTMETILPTLRQLTEAETEVVVHGLYFESEGCHIRNKPLPGMNQHEITDFLSSRSESQSQSEAECKSSGSSSLSHQKPPSFVGFDKDPNVGWYAYGTGPETRAESEVRASAFYTWLLDYLDVQLQCQRDRNGLFDAGVSLPSEVHEKEYDKLSPRQRRRRTAILVGHGDFMGLVLKRIVAGFGFSVEHNNVSHRSAMVHFNTGITELEYFGKGRFLIMKTNNTPHLMQDTDLLTGGGLKDGWSYVMPNDHIMLYEEVSSHFADEVDGHIREQTEALRNLYVSGSRGSFLQRRNNNTGSSSTYGNGNGNGDGNGNEGDEAVDNKCEMVFVVKRGQKVVGCVTYNDEKGCLSNMAIRPSVEKTKIQRDLVDAIVQHAKKAGRKEIYADVNVFVTDGEGGDDSHASEVLFPFLADQGFVLSSTTEENETQGNVFKLFLEST